MIVPVPLERSKSGAPRRLILAVVVLCAALVARDAPAQKAPSWDIERFTLANGLQVTLHVDHSAQMVSTNLWYRVGSASETPGRTGLAHLLEHVMFAGTPNAPSGAFDALLEDAGARSNASTTHDRTSYFQWMPSNVLSLALWLEADRMHAIAGSIDSAEFQRQLEIVRNERRETVDDVLPARGYEAIVKALFPSEHPYSWHPLGRASDLDSLSLADMRTFARAHYSPSNAELVVAGNFDRDSIRALVHAYFGAGLASARRLPPPRRAASRLEHDVVVDEKGDPAAPALFVGWHTVPTFDADDAALDVVARLLAHDESGRLGASMKESPRLAHEVSVAHYSARGTGLLVASMFLAPDASPDSALRRLERTIARLARDGPTPSELAEARIALYMQLLDRHADVMQRAELLNYYSFYAGEPGYGQADQSRYERVTAAEVQRVTRRYLMAPHASVRFGTMKVARPRVRVERQ